MGEGFRTRRAILGAVAFSALTAGFVTGERTDLTGSGMGTLTAEQLRATWYSPERELERGNLLARGITACESLSDEREDDAIQIATGIPGKDSFLEYEANMLQNPDPTSIGRLNNLKQRILIQCLNMRHAPGDRLAARRIERIGIE